MKKHLIYLFLLSSFSLNAHAIEPDRLAASDRFIACFVDASSESLCWQQMLSEPEHAVRYDFGAHYANGDGVKQDFTKGRYWIHQAALKGYSLAQYNLGVMFFDGIGGIQSKECAVHWLNKAASADDETREMAQQALAALSELMPVGMPKVYRVLTIKECEQLPEVVFPGKESVSTPVEETPDRQLVTDVAEQSQDASITFSQGLDVLSANLPAGSHQAVKQLLIEPEPEVKTESSSSFVFREKMGQYFIELGHQLLGQELKAEQDMAHHDIENNTQLNPPHPAVYTTKNTVIETVNVEPVPAEGGFPPEEPLFVERILDHPVGTGYDQLDVMAKNPNEIEEPSPHKTPIIEVPESTAKESVAGVSDVPLPSSAEELTGLALPKTGATRLPIKTDTVSPKPVDSLPEASLSQVIEPAQAAMPKRSNRPPRMNQKADSHPLNLGGAIRRASKGHYTLQLSSASQAEPLQALAKKYKLSNYLVYETQRHGRRWYVLVYGEYAGMTQAKQALQQLPSALKKDTPWIRSLAHVHTEL